MSTSSKKTRIEQAARKRRLWQILFYVPTTLAAGAIIVAKTVFKK